MSSVQNKPPLSDDAVIAEIIPFVEKTMAEFNLPGMAIGIVRAGQVILARGFGRADIESGRPVTPASLFNVGSFTKSFTAIATMQLVEQGLIDLNAKVTTYLPYFRLADQRYLDITIRHLLSHTSGIPADHIESIPGWKCYNFENPETDDGSLERYVRSLGELHLVDDPGSATLHYSNTAFDILGDVIAKVSGQSYEAYMQQQVLLPLGMENSTFLPYNADPVLLVGGHESDFASGEISLLPFIPFNCARSPANGLFANIDDLNQAALTLLNGGKRHGHRVLRGQTMDTMWTPVTSPNFGPFLRSYGLGWILAEEYGHRFAWHSGSHPGFMCGFMLARDEGVGIAVLVNCCSNLEKDAPQYGRTVMLQAMKLLLGIEE